MGLNLLHGICRVEIGILAFCIVYIVNIFIGKRANGAIAKAWAKEFLGPDSILGRNFALVGTGTCSHLHADSGFANSIKVLEGGTALLKGMHKLYCHSNHHSFPLHT